jgi:hypothetical protein
MTMQTETLIRLLTQALEDLLNTSAQGTELAPTHVVIAAQEALALARALQESAAEAPLPHCEHEWHLYGTRNGELDWGCQRCGATHRGPLERPRAVTLEDIAAAEAQLRARENMADDQAQLRARQRGAGERP